MTPAQLFDELHARFGIGVYDDVVSPDTPWWQERGRQIGKLKAMMGKRHVSATQVAIAAEYAASHGKPVKYFPQVFELIPEAMRAHRTAEKRERARRVREDLQDAITEASSLGLEEWASRLMRVAEIDAERLIQDWRNRG